MLWGGNHLVAAIELGRDALGIELDKYYFSLAKANLSNMLFEQSEDMEVNNESTNY